MAEDEKGKGSDPILLTAEVALRLNPAMEKAGLKGITFQMCRRSCSTWMVNGKHGSLKDAQAVLRHTQASTTLGIYVQEHAESMQKAIDSLDRKLFGSPQEVKSRKKKK